MSFDKKYELVEVLRDDGVKTFRARESATGRLVELHVLVGQPGKSEPPFDLLEKVRKLPPDQQTSIVETGEHMGTPYIVTLPITDAANFREWVAARAAAAPKAAYDPLLRVGHWKVPRGSGEPPTVTPMSLELHPPTPRTQRNPTLKPAETAPDITVVFNTAELLIGQQKKPAPAAAATPPPPPQPSADITSVFQAQTYGGTPAFPVPPPPSTPAPPAKDADFEFTRMFETGQGKVPPPADASASRSSEFTQMFQVPAPAAEKATPPPPPQAPPAMPPLSMPPPAAGGPLPVTAAKKEPGEFTRMFQAPAAPASDSPSFPSAPPKLSPAATPPPAEAAPSTPGGPGEFTRMFRAQSTPAEPPAPAPVASTPTPAPSTTVPAMPPPQPLSPGATASPDVTSLFQTGSTPVVSPLPTRKGGNKASDTAQFPAVSATTPAPPPVASTSSTVSFPAAPSANPSAVGDFTSMFQTGQSPTPAAASVPPPAQTVQSPSPKPAAPAPAASAPGEFTSIFKTGDMPAASGPAGQAPGEFTNIFQSAPGTESIPPLSQQQTKPPAAPPAAPPPAAKPAQQPGEFTSIFAASPGQPIGEAGIGAPQSKPQSPSPSMPSGFGAPAGGGGGQEPGEFTRVFSTPMAAPKSPLPMAGPPQTAFSDPNPFAAPSSPLPRPMVQPQASNASPFGQPQSPFGQSLPPLPQTPQMGQPQGGMIPPRPFAAPAQPSIKDEYQQMFGGGDRSLTPQQQQPMSPMGNSPGVPGGGGGFGTATQSFQAFSGTQGQAPQAGGPSEYTRMFNAPSMAAPPPAPAVQAAAAPKGLLAKKWPIFVFAGILLLLIIGAIIMFVFK